MAAFAESLNSPSMKQIAPEEASLDAGAGEFYRGRLGRRRSDQSPHPSRPKPDPSPGRRRWTPTMA